MLSPMLLPKESPCLKEARRVVRDTPNEADQLQILGHIAMSNLILHSERVNPSESPQARAIILPEPRVAGGISIRLAVPGAGDLKFIDDLQKKHSKMVGRFPTKQIEANISKGKVLIAEEGIKAPPEKDQGIEESAGSRHWMPGCLDDSMPRVPVGYCISNDRYLKHDDCGIVYQLNVMPAKQRGLIGATLIKAVF